MHTDQHRSRIAARTKVVRRGRVNDLENIVAIHKDAFCSFFLTRLGTDFLVKYYGLVLTYHSGILLVSEKQDGLEGFACGFADPAGFYELMWRTKRVFIRPVLASLVRNPSLIMKVAHGTRRIRMPSIPYPQRSCELSSIAVASAAVGNGVGKSLVDAFIAEARLMGARSVYLTTDADGNDAVNAFYRGVGFESTRHFLQYQDRWMNEYVINPLYRNGHD